MESYNSIGSHGLRIQGTTRPWRHRFCFVKAGARREPLRHSTF